MTEEIKKDSPDTDKSLELTDDTLPEMGKGEELVEGKEGEETLSPDLEATMKRKGFKDVSELAKAYDASERKQTELEKDARLKSLTAEIPARPKIERTFTEVPALTKDPYDMSKEEYEAHQTQREKAFEERMTAKYEDAEADKKWNREYRETMAIVNKDKKRFEQITPQLQELHRRYPDAPLSEIYPEADKMEKEQGLRKKEDFIRETFGPDADVDKLKTIMSKARPAIVSDAGGAGATGAGTKKPVDVIWDNIANADVRRDS